MPTEQFGQLRNTPVPQHSFETFLEKYEFRKGSSEGPILVENPGEYATYLEAHENPDTTVVLVKKVTAPGSGASGPPPPGDPFRVRVVTWTPNVFHLPNTHRLMHFEMALVHARRMPASENALVATVFLAPEYVFSGIGTPTGADVNESTAEEQARHVESLKKLSNKYTDLFIVPGTLIWRDAQDEVRNSTWVLRNGSIVRSTDGRDRYDKTHISYEREHMEGHHWVAGEHDKPFFDFALGALRCRLEICRDHGTEEKKPAPDLVLVTATKLGQEAGPDQVQEGGFCVHADGEGFARKLPKSKHWGGPEQKDDDPLNAFDLIIHKPPES